MAARLVALISPHLPSRSVAGSVSLQRPQVRGVPASQCLRADEIQVIRPSLCLVFCHKHPMLP